MAGWMPTVPGFDQRSVVYVARYTLVSFRAIGPPILLGFAVWFVYGIVTVLEREPFPANPSPSDYVYYSMFVGLLGSCAVLCTAMAVSWLLVGTARRFRVAGRPDRR